MNKVNFTTNHRTPMDINGELIRRVWEKATLIPGQDPDTFRLDMSGAWIRLKDFNNDDSQYGWTISADAGVEITFVNLAQLMPLHTRNTNANALTDASASMLGEPMV